MTRHHTIMKKFFCILLAAFVLAACSSTSDRDHILKVYNWGSYIDESLIPEFEQWYQEQTGEPVKIIYQTFDINETMLSKIEKGHEDFDVVCPSDYIIERMLRSNLLLPIEHDFGKTPDYIKDGLSPYVIDHFKLLTDDEGRNASDYAVGYMWGYTGLLYNRSKVDSLDVTTWDAIKNPKYSGMIFMKDAPRDVYSQLILYLNQDKVKNPDGSFNLAAMDSLMRGCTDESLKQVEDYLDSARQYIGGWEADFGKELMTQERGLIDVAWSGDAAWAIDEAAAVGVDLWYSVPKEGATVWFDGWVIPKYAKNVKAARYFINFLCMPENAIRNSEEIGYSSACGAKEVMESYIDDSYPPVDLSYFFGEDADSVCVNPVLMADKSVIERCPMEHDWTPGENGKLIAMWSRAKGDGAGASTYVIIGTVIVLAAVYITNSAVKRSRRNRRRRRRQTWANSRNS